MTRDEDSAKFVANSHKKIASKLWPQNIVNNNGGKVNGTFCE